MPNLTTNFGFNQPLVNNATDADLWGAQLNTNWGNLDTYLYQRTPPGIIHAYGAASAPTGWLLCDGSAVSRTTYAALFAIIAENFGQGDNTTTFNLPDLRGRFIRGWDNGASRDPDKASRTAMNTGGNTGDNVGSVQDDATARPSSAFTTDSQGAHTHNITKSDGNFTTASAEYVKAATALNQATQATDSAGAHTHSITGGGDNETRPLNAYLNFIIKT